MGSRITVDPEKLEALARYNEANGYGPVDPKVTKLNKPPRVRASKADTRPKRRQKMTPLEYRDMLIETYQLQHLKKAENIPAYDVTKATRYPKVVMWKKAGDERLDSVLRRYGYAMKEQGITAREFKSWRESYMLMTPEQLGALIRVTARQIRNWENGESEIPFSMWWMIHCTLQDPEYFLTRPGFHDFYIDYHEGDAFLCSHTYPDIRWSATDMYFHRTALTEVIRQRHELRGKDQTIDELTAENTRLRQMLKTEGVTAELKAMHEHIGAMLQRINTADVVPFKESAEVVQLPRQASA